MKMTTTKARCLLGVLGVSAVLAVAPLVGAVPAESTGRPAAGSAMREDLISASTSMTEERGYTRASNQSDVAFYGPGVVKEVLVKAGDPVAAGKTVIARQDDSEEQGKLVVAQGEVEVAKQQVRFTQVKLEKAKVDMKRMETLYADIIAQGGTNSEIDEARVAVKSGEIEVIFTTEQMHQKERELALEKVHLQHRTLIAPISGVISKMDLHAGEGTDLTKPAGIQIVQNSPLWVETQIASTKADALHIGQTVEVRYVDGTEWMPAKVILLAPVASAGANVRLVRLELPNKANRESGLQVFVRIPENLASVTK